MLQEGLCMGKLKMHKISRKGGITISKMSNVLKAAWCTDAYSLTTYLFL